MLTRDTLLEEQKGTNDRRALKITIAIVDVDTWYFAVRTKGSHVFH